MSLLADRQAVSACSDHRGSKNRRQAMGGVSIHRRLVVRLRFVSVTQSGHQADVSQVKSGVDSQIADRRLGRDLCGTRFRSLFAFRWRGRRALSALLRCLRRCVRCGGLSALRGGLRHGGRRLSLGAGRGAGPNGLSNGPAGSGGSLKSGDEEACSLTPGAPGADCPNFETVTFERPPEPVVGSCGLTLPLLLRFECVSPAIVLSPRRSSSTCCDVEGSRYASALT